MTYRDLIADLTIRDRTCKAFAGLAAQVIFSTILRKTMEGERISIPGFGTFEVREHKARLTKNLDGTMVTIPRMRRLSFRPSKHAKRPVKISFDNLTKEG